MERSIMDKEQLLDLVHSLYNRYDRIVYDNLCDVCEQDGDTVCYTHVVVAATNVHYMLKYTIIYGLINDDKTFSEESSLLELISSYTSGKDAYDDRILSVAQKISSWSTACMITGAPADIDEDTVKACADTVSSIWFRLTDEEE